MVELSKGKPPFSKPLKIAVIVLASIIIVSSFTYLNSLQFNP